MELQPGNLVLNKYRIISRLGGGGMAITYMADDTLLPRRVVIKTSPYDRPSEHVTIDIARLQREAQLMTGIKHTNLPIIYDADFTDRPIIVMEYIPGKTLDETLVNGPIEISAALDWLRQLLDALAVLHATGSGIIHRDVTPKNIVIRQDEQGKRPPIPVLLDFGIARQLDGRATTTLVQGYSTQPYAPIELYEPEEFQSTNRAAAEYLKKLGPEGRISRPATDLYALAATFYHALTRDTPPPPDQRARYDTLTPPHVLRPDIPLTLSGVLMQALKLHPAERYQTAQAMRAALDAPVGPTPPGERLIHIPTGRYRIGSDRWELREEAPAHGVSLDAFAIDRYLVTNEEYQAFINANPRRPLPTSSDPGAADYCWDKSRRRHPPGAEHLPVVLVTWQDADDYCRWLAARKGEPYRLPTEAEWEVAAAWDPVTQAARPYPWGPNYDDSRSNAGHGQPAEVGHFAPQGDSAFGLVDAVGNVWQWTSNGLWRYPYRRDGRERPNFAEKFRVVRGGSFAEADPVQAALCAQRGWRERVGRFIDVGFRVAVSVPSPLARQTLPHRHPGSRQHP